LPDDRTVHDPPYVDDVVTLIDLLDDLALEPSRALLQYRQS
jgi:hypothetical protein